MDRAERERLEKKFTGTLDDHGTPFDPKKHVIKLGKPAKRKDGHWQGRGGRPFAEPKKELSGARSRVEFDGILTEQLYRAAKQYKFDEKMNKRGIDALRAIGDQVVDMAVKGDKWAIQFLAERLEGKATQKIETRGQIEHIHEIPIAFANSKGELIDANPVPGEVTTLISS